MLQNSHIGCGLTKYKEKNIQGSEAVEQAAQTDGERPILWDTQGQAGSGWATWWSCTCLFSARESDYCPLGAPSNSILRL